MGTDWCWCLSRETEKLHFFAFFETLVFLTIVDLWGKICGDDNICTSSFWLGFSSVCMSTPCPYQKSNQEGEEDKEERTLKPSRSNHEHIREIMMVREHTVSMLLFETKTTRDICPESYSVLFCVFSREIFHPDWKHTNSTNPIVTNLISSSFTYDEWLEWTKGKAKRWSIIEHECRDQT